MVTSSPAERVRRRSIFLLENYALAHYAFPSEMLENRAEELDVIEWDGKLQMPAFAWSAGSKATEERNEVPKSSG